jgi:hypothetical protein
MPLRLGERRVIAGEQRKGGQPQIVRADLGEARGAIRPVQGENTQRMSARSAASARESRKPFSASRRPANSSSSDFRIGWIHARDRKQAAIGEGNQQHRVVRLVELIRTALVRDQPEQRGDQIDPFTVHPHAEFELEPVHPRLLVDLGGDLALHLGQPQGKLSATSTCQPSRRKAASRSGA